jgi:hypothetical protein
MGLFRWRGLALLVATLAGPPALVAEAGYVTRGDELGYLAWVDFPSGANGVLIMDTGLNPMSGLALSPAGELYGVVVPSRFAPPGPARLVRVHPETQSLEFRGPLAIGIPEGLFDQDLGLAFDALGRLWLVTDDGRLFEVDPDDATTTAQVALGIPAQGLAGCGRSLYALTHPTGSALPLSLVRIDPEAGTTTAFASLESENPFFSAATGAGLDFGSDGRLFAVTRREDAIEAFTSFAELDPVSGKLVSASTGLGWGPNGLAIAPPPASCPGRGVVEVPTASSLGLACLAGFLALAGATLLRGSALRRGLR